jgi:hypothetical protein
LSAEITAQIEEVLSASPGPLTVREIAAALGVPPDEVAEVVWGAPHRFSWQPEGRWTLAVVKAGLRPQPMGGEQEDAREAVIAPQSGVELRAMKLASGATLRVTARALDSASFFTVRSEGSDLQLVLNASHEVFEAMPMPFANKAGGNFETLAELLLAAWAVHEAEAPAGAKRELEDARLFWGRRLLDLIDRS